ncbi:unnamed protein product, partial [Musa hybrid cultivar]
SEPESAGLFEEGDEGAAYVGGHDPVHGPNQLPADEYHGYGGAAGCTTAEEAGEGALHLPPARVLVQLHHRRAHPHAAEEPLQGVAHAAGAHAEDHHRALRRHPLHPLQRVHRRRRPHPSHVTPRLRCRRRLVVHP